MQPHLGWYGWVGVAYYDGFVADTGKKISFHDSIIISSLCIYARKLKQLPS